MPLIYRKRLRLKVKKSKLKLERLKMRNSWLAQHWELDILRYLLQKQNKTAY